MHGERIYKNNAIDLKTVCWYYLALNWDERAVPKAKRVFRLSRAHQMIFLHCKTWMASNLDRYKQGRCQGGETGRKRGLEDFIPYAGAEAFRLCFKWIFVVSLNINASFFTIIG